MLLIEVPLLLLLLSPFFLFFNKLVELRLMILVGVVVAEVRVVMKSLLDLASSTACTKFGISLMIEVFLGLFVATDLL